MWTTTNTGDVSDVEVVVGQRYHVSQHARGTYYLRTKWHYPYCAGYHYSFLNEIFLECCMVCLAYYSLTLLSIETTEMHTYRQIETNNT